MRNILGLAVTLGLILGSTGRLRGDDRASALAVIDQAIRAHGGEQNLAKTRIRNRAAKGTSFIQAQDIHFTTELLMDLPDRGRDDIDIEADAGGAKVRILQVVNGDQGWRSVAGQTADMGKDEVEDIRQEYYVIWVTTLVPLKDKSFELGPIPDVNVNGQPAAGVKVVSKGRPEVKLYFDKGTGLLVKIERQARLAGLELRKEYLYSDQQDFDGAKLATREIELMNGKKSQEVSISAYKFPSKVEQSSFAKP